MSAASFEKTLAVKTAKEYPVVSGCVLAAINKLGEQIYFKCCGDDRLGPGGSPLQPNATFWIASCTKLISTVAALQCVERGQIGLDDPVDKILPELSDPKILKSAAFNGKGTESEAFLLTSAKTQITLRHLLTHSSGLGYDFAYPELLKWRESRNEEPLSLSGQVVNAHKLPLLFEPGEGWAYGGGVDWAGELVARLNKTTLEEYMRDNILTPLGMGSSTFRLELRPDIKAGLVETAQRLKDGSLTSSHKAWPDHAMEDCAGAGLYSSAPDYLKVLGDLIKDSPTLLSKATIEREMFAPQFSEDSRSLSGLLSAPDLASSMTGVTETISGINLGLGGLYLTDDIGNVKKGTLTWGGLPNLRWFANRAEGIAALYATQLMPPGDAACADLTRAFFEEVWRLHSN